MKILWFTNQPFPGADEAIGRSASVRGGWMPTLGEALSKTESIELAVATVASKPPISKITINKITHFFIPAPKNQLEELTLRPSHTLLSYCQNIVKEFRPDLVHFHGAEYFYGILAAEHYIKVPSVLSIQGLIEACAKSYFGMMPLTDVIRSQSLYGVFRGFGLIYEKRHWGKRAKIMESKILKGQNNIIGRTLWDRAHIRAINPEARYYHCDEAIRKPFFQTSWDINYIQRHSIFVSSATYPLKGFHVLLRAAEILYRDFKDITIRVTNGLANGRTRWQSYNNYLLDLIGELGLESRVIPLGLISAEQMAEELSCAHCFAMPSLIENSSNSLAEAMIVGTPCAVSLAGGIPSMIDDGVNALGFPPGDEATLAECIRIIFNDDEVALRISQSARTVAIPRHSINNIVPRMMNIYSEILSKS